jgi:hypothetical protein
MIGRQRASFHSITIETEIGSEKIIDNNNLAYMAYVWLMRQAPLIHTH